MPRRPFRPWSVLLLAFALVLGACGGDDGGADTAPDDREDGAASPGGEDAGADGVEAGDEAEMGGPVRTLPGLADHAELSLDAFLQEVFGFPTSAPVPALELVRAYAQGGGPAGGDRVTYSAEYSAPDGEVDDVFAVVADAFDPEVWTAPDAVEEPSPGIHSQRWTGSLDEAEEAQVTYREADGEVIVTVTSAVAADPPAALWPWAADVVVPDGVEQSSWLVQVPDASGGPAVLLDMRWRGEPGGHDALAAFVAALPDGPLTPGEVTTSTSPFTETEVAVEADGGFTGSLSAVLTGADSAPDLILTGTVPLD